MASKFQNRLVGTIVLVALGVIILPGLLDGQKKHYQDEFAAIPLVPKPGDRDEPDMLPAATQALPAQPPEGAAEEVRAGDAAAPSLDPSRIPVNSNSFDDVQLYSWRNAVASLFPVASSQAFSCCGSSD